MKTLTQRGVLVMFLAFFASQVFAQEEVCSSDAVAEEQSGNGTTFSPGHLATLSVTKRTIGIIEESVQDGDITRSQADAIIGKRLRTASEAIGQEVTLAALATVPDNLVAPTVELNWAQRALGGRVFVNILWVLAILGIAAFSLILLFSLAPWLIEVFVHIPLVVYEVLFFLIGCGLVAWGRLQSSAGTAPFIGLTGCVLMGCALIFAAKNHKWEKPTALVSGILAVVWSLVALLYGDSMIGFAAIAALMSFLGFTVAIEPLTYYIGFEDEAAVGRATTAAFGILVPFCVLRVLDTSVPFVSVFEGGALWLGSFVGYVGLLIASSRWYSSRHVSYATIQVITVIAGVAALFVGSVFSIGELQKIGGTFFVLWGIEKFIEFVSVWEGVRTKAFFGLVGSSAVYFFCLFVRDHAELFSKYLLIS